MAGRSPDRLGRWEVLGAWLRLWTPQRDAVVPPVPWRKIAVGGVLALAAAAVGIVALLNAESRRNEADERARQAAARRHAAFLVSVDRRQAPHHGRGPADPGGAEAETSGRPATAGAAARRRSRRALLAAAQADIDTFAAARARKPIRGVDCEPFPRSLDTTPPVEDLARAAAAYDCLAVRARFETGAIGTPFRLVAHFDSGRYAFCEIVPLGDRDRLSHPLPGACRL